MIAAEILQLIKNSVEYCRDEALDYSLTVEQQPARAVDTVEIMSGCLVVSLEDGDQFTLQVVQGP